MQRRGITNLFTLNPGDFARLTTIQVFTPSQLIDGSAGY
jgi:hypothetical protein